MREEWHSEANAYAYHAFSKKYPAYVQLAEDLVRVTSPARNKLALDLACGTGISVCAILRNFPDVDRVLATDRSHAMISVGNQHLRDPRVRWLVATVDCLPGTLRVAFDVLICSAAIWYLNIASTLPVAHALLRPGGSLAFNLPLPMLRVTASTNIIDIPSGDTSRGVARIRPGKPTAPPSTHQRGLTLNEVFTLLAQSGFQPSYATVFAYDKPNEQQSKTWSSIPVFAPDRRLPCGRQRSIERPPPTGIAIPGSDPQKSHWVAFTAVRL